METSDFQFVVDWLDDFRVLKIVFPATINTSRTAANTARYLQLWDEGTPTVGLADLDPLLALDEESLRILSVLLKRTRILPGFVGSAWIIRRDHKLRDTFLGLVVGTGRDPASVFDTEPEALAYLSGKIAAYRGPA